MFLTAACIRLRQTFGNLVLGALVATVASGPCYADQWPSHFLPIKTSEVDAYGHIIGLRSSLGVCLKDAAGITPDIRDCLGDEHDFQDHRLNQTYKKLVASLSKAERKHLREEERRWMAFRDTFCAPDPEPGQAQELGTYECLVDQTADRASELESRLDSTSEAFSGHWLYKQACGFEQSVDLSFDQKGNSVTGQWSEGTRLNGSFGSLQGRVEKDRLYMRYCEGDERTGYTECAEYDPESVDYFVRTGKDLVRYLFRRGPHNGGGQSSKHLAWTVPRSLIARTLGHYFIPKSVSVSTI